MAFTFDADPASAGMNSYVTVLDADDYFASRYGSEVWTELDDAGKETILAHATRQLNLLEYGSLKTRSAQPLKWPRSGIYDNEGNAYSPLTVPVLMQQAVCEQAHWVLSESGRVLDDTTLGQFSDFKAGPLTLKIRNNPLSGLSSDAIDMIKAIGDGVLLSDAGGGAITMNMKL